MRLELGLRCSHRGELASREHMNRRTIRLRNRRVESLFACLLAMIAFTVTAVGQTGKAPFTVVPGSVTVAPEPSTVQTGKAPSVSMAAVPLVTAPRTGQTVVNLNFRVPRGYHINSNAPKSEFLIPTALKMNLGSATDIVLGKIGYPEGKDLSFPFSPDEKLNVYTGDFTIALTIHPLRSVVPGKYVMHGVLRYQACDNAACYPPKTLPVNLELKVVKEKPTPRRNPAQSPHVHN
ncbi:MAG: protein-disulfide reductase DsbD N-terminal domain-containing protein [Acidobacteriia bacterium]|nr:protein-disulfide reductase DsbD N-terminal domain-containing protein [Terriglobia bacterium]